MNKINLDKSEKIESFTEPQLKPAINESSISFKTRLGASLANLSQKNATTSHGNLTGNLTDSDIKNKDGRVKRKLTDLNILCKGINSDLCYYKNMEPKRLVSYVETQKITIQKTLDLLLPYESKILDVVDKFKPDKDPIYYRLPLNWPINNSLILSLMKAVMTADNILYLIKISSDNRLASANKAKSMRKNIIDEIKLLYNELIKNQRHYNKKRSGGMYNIKY